MHKTVAVIGHVDHGKTALVKALTGMDTDCLDEERKRGLSIVLGFASLQWPTGLLHLIDAPGHADFIQTAAIGLSGADAILLVVDSTKGPSHQTIEHLKLAQLFGIQDVIVALSKIDLDQHPSNRTQSNEIADLLREMEFNAPSIIACSSRTMEGIDRVTTALKGLFSLNRQRSLPNQAFLPIDRVFSAEGAGTVVTGTLLGGELSLDAPVIAPPTETVCSIRELQIAGQTAAKAIAGARVAVNLRGIKSQNIKKGDVLCAPNQGKPSRLFDVAINTQIDGTRAISHMEVVTIRHGTRNSPARVRILAKDDQDAIIGQLEFETDQIGFSGQRFVIRRPASFETVGGGEILDAQATLAKRKKERHVSVLRAALEQNAQQIATAISDRDNGSIDLFLLSRLARRTVHECLDALGSNFVRGENGFAHSVAQIRAVKAKIIDSTKAFHKDRPLRPHAPHPSSSGIFSKTPEGLLINAVQSLIDEKAIEARLDGISILEHDPNKHVEIAERDVYDSAFEQLRRTGLMPDSSSGPNPSNIEQADLIDLMIWNGDIVRLYNHALKQTVILHSETIESAITSLQSAFPGRRPFKTGEARAALSTNRKIIVPLLEHLDVLGITRRDGDIRVIQSIQTSE